MVSVDDPLFRTLTTPEMEEMVTTFAVTPVPHKKTSRPEGKIRGKLFRSHDGHFRFSPLEKFCHFPVFKCDEPGCGCLNEKFFAFIITDNQLDMECAWMVGDLPNEINILDPVPKWLVKYNYPNRRQILIKPVMVLQVVWPALAHLEKRAYSQHEAGENAETN